MIKVTHKDGTPLRVAPGQIMFLSVMKDGYTKIHMSNGGVLTVRESMDAVERMVNNDYLYARDR